MTPSTTNTAAREVIEMCRAALAEELAGWDIEPPIAHVKTAHDACVNWLTITQQQGGEQEVRGVSDSDEAAHLAKLGFYDGPSTLIADAAAITAALRSKQPAASEGDVARLQRIHSALSRHVGDTDPYIAEDATDDEIEREEPVFWAAQQLAMLIDNTSKQAAGEAVTDEMIDRACDAYDAVAFELANRTAIREALTAALQAGTP